MNHASALRFFAGLLSWGATGLSGAEEVKPTQAATKPSHVLFMGADLAVQQGKRFHQVQDVDGSEFVIKVGAENRFVRTRMRATNVKVEPGLKLSPLSVRLDDLQGAAGYTPAKDPRHKFNARSGAAGGAAAARDLANYNVTELTATMAQLDAGDSRRADIQTMLDKQQQSLGVADYQIGTDYGSIPNMANGLSLELAEGNFDMIDVSFKISSPEPLDDPYMVVLVEILPRGAKPHETATVIHAQALDPIGEKPKYIRVREGGMPVGFKYISHEVHIYNRGKEVATNVSGKRVELTRDEARQYLVIEHLSAHKNASVPPTPVPGSLPPGVRSRLSPEQLNQVCYARVSKEGTLLGVFVDEGASLPLADAATVAILNEAFFKPSLHQGKPVEGTVRIRVADLAL